MHSQWQSLFFDLLRLNGVALGKESRGKSEERAVLGLIVELHEVPAVMSVNESPSTWKELYQVPAKVP